MLKILIARRKAKKLKQQAEEPEKIDEGTTAKDAAKMSYDGLEQYHATTEGPHKSDTQTKKGWFRRKLQNIRQFSST